jgi:sodium-dependent phosphate cotransporter
MSPLFPEKKSEAGGGWAIFRAVLLTLIFLYTFLIGIECMGKGLKSLNLGQDLFHYFGRDANPFLGLLVGILATTLMQSSSATTALIVAMTGSQTIAISAAVPMVMGANIGTTVTNTIASLAHVNQKAEFQRAFAAATCHDFFNFLAVLILLPAELLARAIWGVGGLERIAGELAGWTSGVSGSKEKGFVKRAIKAGYETVKDAGEAIGLDGKTLMTVLIITGLVIIFTSLTGVVKSMKTLVVTRLERYVNRFLGTGGPVAIILGCLLTIMVQSSSITTSVLVPLAGAGLLTVRQIYPVTLGANIGTTVTAMIAAMAFSGTYAECFAARQIAFVHLLFNIVGILILFVPRPWRWLPVRLAEKMGVFAAEKKRWALVYVFGIFYCVPGLIFLITHFVG